jgi:hypothetical protein
MIIDNVYVCANVESVLCQAGNNASFGVYVIAQPIMGFIRYRQAFSSLLLYCTVLLHQY